jgi:mannose-6-phosphate isomerase
MLPPLVFTPYLRTRPWGGTRLRDQLGKTLPGSGTYGESWELAALPEHDSIVAEGALAGTKLSTLWNTRRPELIGNTVPPYGGVTFPLLIKWLDCSETLSVQVHPDDAGAQAILGEPCGKAESWIVYDTTPDAVAYYGLKPGTTRAAFERHLDAGTVAECLGTLRPQRGEVIDVPPGTVHALGAGQLVLEVEQPSDATFRVFDWNRVGPDGRPRELHREQALRSIDWNRAAPPPLEGREWPNLGAGVEARTLVTTPSFVIHRIDARQPFANPFEQELCSWTVLFGAGVMVADDYERPFRTGATVLTSAGTRGVRWLPQGSSPLTLIAATLPRRKP